MNLSPVLSMVSEVNFYIIVGVIWGLFVTIFWMICGWRAMKAHEEISTSMRIISRETSDISKRLITDYIQKDKKE